MKELSFDLLNERLMLYVMKGSVLHSSAQLGKKKEPNLTILFAISCLGDIWNVGLP